MRDRNEVVALGADTERDAILRMLQTIVRACDKAGLSDEATTCLRVSSMIKSGRHLSPGAGRDWVRASEVLPGWMGEKRKGAEKR